MAASLMFVQVALWGRLPYCLHISGLWPWDLFKASIEVKTLYTK